MKKIYLLYQYHNGKRNREVIAASPKREDVITYAAKMVGGRMLEATELTYDDVTHAAVEDIIMLTGGALIMRYHNEVLEMLEKAGD